MMAFTTAIRSGQWAQLQGWLKDRRAKRREEASRADAVNIDIAGPSVSAKPPRRPLPLSTKARRKLRQALAPPPVLTTVQISAVALTTVQLSFPERRAQLRAEWEAHERAIEQEDEEAIVRLFLGENYAESFSPYEPGE